MPKRISDMTPKGRREAHKKAWDEVVQSKSVPTTFIPVTKTKPKLVEDSSSYNTSNTSVKRVARKSRYGLWVVAGASILFLIFSFSVIFAGATLTVRPRIEELNLNQNFSAVKGGVLETLPFELIVVSGEEVKDVLGGEEKEVSRKATGKVILYNAFGGVEQKLSADTRLEGSNGKIYKTKKAVTIPKMVGTTPGSIEVEIYADVVGEAHNSEPLDFTILGFKGTSKYSKFYARSKGDVRGGFVGKEREVPEAEKSAILNELKTSLNLKLFQKAIDQIPSGFILYKDATSITATDESFISTAGEDNVVVTVKGTLYGILFEEKALTQEIIKKKFGGEEGNDIYIQNIRDLDFSVAGEASFPGFADVENLNFNLTGTSQAIWRVDEEKLITDVVGQKKSILNQVLSQHANIVSADLSLKPFWKRSLPDKKEDIKTIVTYP